MALGVRTLIEERLEQLVREQYGVKDATIYFDGERFTCYRPGFEGAGRNLPADVLDHLKMDKHEARDLVEW